MKTTLLFMISFILVTASAGAEREITATRTLTELMRVSEEQNLRERRARGCLIQLRDRIPPTLCYVPREKQPDLDSKCRILTRTAIHLPKIDRFTSEDCRFAIERRAADLAYAR